MKVATTPTSGGREITAPYLLFLGNAQDEVVAKTALGIAQWRREDCTAQAALADCRVDTGLPTMSVREAAAAGARTLIVGIAPPGGALPEQWIAPLAEALQCGLDLASGLHVPLQSVTILAETAAKTGRRLINVRLPEGAFPVGKGLKRTGKRLLTVGTDCAVGKKYTALVIHRELVRHGVPATFRATGQTGILISGGGVAIDAVVADFVAGAAESLSPSAPVDHWDIIEGQGSLLHPSYAAVSLGLLHGSQPDAFVVCHEPTRKRMANTTFPIPAIEEVIDLNVRLGRLTNPLIRCVGIAINTSHLQESEGRALVVSTGRRLGLPCTDPLRFGASQIVEALL